MCRIFAFVARITPAVSFEFAAIRAKDIDLVAVLRELLLGMSQFTAPNPDLPAGLL